MGSPESPVPGPRFPVPYSESRSALRARRATRASGFTLLEILAALALLALLMVGVWSGIHTATRTVRSGEAQVERLDTLRGAQQFLRRDFAQALPIPWARHADGRVVVFSGNAREMRFVAPLPGFLGRLGPQLQTLQLVPDGDDGRLRLQVAFALLPPDGSAPQPFGQPQVLMRDIRRGSFAYRGFDLRQRPVGWVPQWPNASHAPTLVQIQLELDRGHWPLLRAPLRVDASAVNRAAVQVAEQPLRGGQP